MKRYNLRINNVLRKEFCAIRSKLDIIIFLLKTMQYISSFPYEELIYSSSNPSKVDIVINVDKMSRIFYCEQDKIHTFQFPFLINIENEKFKLSYKDRDIDNELIAIILSILEREIEAFESLEAVVDIFLGTMHDFGVTNNYYSNYCWDIIMFLLMFEPGYIRYDYDNTEGRVDSIKHPLNHLDFFYSSNNTFKIGLNDRFDHEKLIKLVDINDKCTYLK